MKILPISFAKPMKKEAANEKARKYDYGYKTRKKKELSLLNLMRINHQVFGQSLF